MDDHRHARAMTDASLDRDIAHALAVDPSPEFLARMRMRIANEPAPRRFGTPAATQVWVSVAAAVVTVVVAAVMVNRGVRDRRPASTLEARTVGTTALSLTDVARGSTSSPRASQELTRPEPIVSRANHQPARPEPVEGRAQEAVPLLDPHETRALRSFIAGVRDGRIDLTPLLAPTAPPPMPLAPVDNLVIPPIAIAPIASTDSAQGERSR